MWRGQESGRDRKREAGRGRGEKRWEWGQKGISVSPVPTSSVLL